MHLGLQAGILNFITEFQIWNNISILTVLCTEKEIEAQES